MDRGAAADSFTRDGLARSVAAADGIDAPDREAALEGIGFALGRSASIHRLEPEIDPGDLAPSDREALATGFGRAYPRSWQFWEVF
jgi:hypothetical protein